MIMIHTHNNNNNNNNNNEYTIITIPYFMFYFSLNTYSSNDNSISKTSIFPRNYCRHHRKQIPAFIIEIEMLMDTLHL